MPQSSQEKPGIFQIPKDFSGKTNSNTITALEVGQDKPIKENNPIYDTDGISWGTLCLLTFIIIVLGIIMVRYINLQSWREFFLQPNARKKEQIENDQNALKLINDIVALNKKTRTEQGA